MDYNPSTINKLIGAKVASYKELTDSQPKKEDFSKKEDIHINDTPYNVKENPTKYEKSKKELRVEEAYSFILNELDDIYDDLYEDSEGESTGKIEDAYGENQETQGPDYSKEVQEGMGRLLDGGPKKRWYKPEFIRKRQSRKHYDKARRKIIGGLVGEAAKVDGRFNPEEAKKVALLADSVTAPAARAGAKVVSSSARRIMNSVKK